MTPGALTKKLVVSFEGEDGVDGGALTTSLCTRLFKDVASYQLLQSLDGSSHLLTVAVDAPNNETTTDASRHQEPGPIHHSTG